MSVVISVESLCKSYRLGTINTGTFRGDVHRWWAKLRGQPNPHLKIGEKDHGNRDGETIWALNDVNLEVKQGEVLGIIGRNGAGKSTLLKIFSRVTAPTSGEVKVKGRIASLLEVGTGFHPELTGRENIYLNGVILGMKKAEIARKFDEIVDFSGVEQFIDTPVKRYSSGMYVRLAFAVAAHLEPEILVVDEVLAVGDAEFQKKCLGKMSDVAHEGRTVLFVSHNMGAIRQLCPRSILINAGSIIINAETALVVDSYLQNDALNSEVSEKTFEPDDTKKLQLLAVRLTNSRGQISNRYDCDSPVNIELTIKLNRSEPGYYSYLQITQKDGTVVLIGDSNDVKNNLLDGLMQGINRIILTIPPRSLGAGTYSVYLNFTDFNGNSLDSPGPVCSFHLDDILTSRGNRRGGYLSTLITWEIQDVG